MHVREANRLIRDAVVKDPGDFIYLISTRDPIARFVSSFNWDKHNVYLSRPNAVAKVKQWFEEFPTIDALARALSYADPQKAQRALHFSRFGHMGKGPAWYTPLDLIPLLPKDRTFLVETENFATDIQNFVWSANPALHGMPVKVFHDKSDFTAGYSDAKELFPKNLSMEGRRNLRILLNEDVLAWSKLRQDFRRPVA
ncbi:hypothetical protein [Paracoccus laeviglucosivorans]|uniref:Sulfotransferase family protein n=1 Tax=Paracoccus laeviglucosivorans TaxID=1197861 RepID=A0A521FQB7_9RHOB|nr:hypothetical protein [Paracoccus laeviglucosivorans]SMO98427.1 hypothetical protein SAMN06265221_1343 [Paracoccus laeviglucosivorans]